ncbi:hypothetical protein [uncultured Shimia sp.]|uniref:hypothetical protein n=1 Tax=uncultured Shimia sp. TaxID=573152 RepID=UPI0025F40714|nr:hypothetical protein [uncultured Shimia sp.]
MRYLVLPFVLAANAALADPAEITAVKTWDLEEGWRFDVTITHPDTGWDHYADGWRIETKDGQVLGTRILAHPHVNEQPFRRSLTRVWIPPEITTIFVRSKCNQDDWGEETTKVSLN